MAQLTVSPTLPIILDPLANDYLLFNPDFHDETTKQQQHSNFLMTPFTLYSTLHKSFSQAAFANEDVSQF